ncbi:MAG: hypothetical protein V2A73_14150 [Pseudomonadota bacterium]
MSSGKERWVLRGHENKVSRVVFSPAGVLLSSSRDGTVRRWDLAAGIHRVTIGGQSAILGLAIDPTGRQLATGSVDRTIRLWLADTGTELLVLRGHQDAVTAVAFSPDGRTLTSSSIDKSVRYWNLTSGSSDVLGLHEGHVNTVAFSPDGRLVASSTLDNPTRLWRVGVEAGKADGGHAGAVFALDFSPDGSYLASAGGDRDVLIWDTRSGRQRQRLAGHSALVNGVVIGPDGKTVVSASHDRTVRIWETESGSGEELAPNHRALAVDVATSKNGNMFVSADIGGQVFVWDARTRSLVGKLAAKAGINAVAISPDGALVAGAATNGSIFIWDLARFQLEAELRGHEGEVGGITFIPGGRSLISGGRDGTIRRWDLASGAGTVLGTGFGLVWRLTTTPDGRLLGIPTFRVISIIWDLAASKTTAVLRGNRTSVLSLRFTPDGKLAATAGDDGTVRTWDVATGHPYWRAPLLLRSPPRLFTHRGWSRLDREQGTATGTEATGQSATDALPASDSWRRAVAEQARFAVQAESSDPPLAANGGDLLCVLTYDDAIQLWSMSADRLLANVSLHSVTGTAPTRRPESTPAATPTSASIATPPAAPVKSRTVVTATAQRMPAMAKLAATRDGCLVLVAGRAFQLRGSADATAGNASNASNANNASNASNASGRAAGLAGGTIRELAAKARAIAFQNGRILVASGEHALVLDEDGNELTRVKVEEGVSALGLVDGGRLLVLGYDAGEIVLQPIAPGATKPGFGFEETLPFIVERISEGPRQTLIVGDNVGNLGIWHLETGKRLRHFKLHGPIAHQLVDSQTHRLYAASELGDYRVIDLSAQYQDYCELLGDIWSSVPVVWQDGMPVVHQPPARHRCRQPR